MLKAKMLFDIFDVVDKHILQFPLFYSCIWKAFHIRGSVSFASSKGFNLFLRRAFKLAVILLPIFTRDFSNAFFDMILLTGIVLVICWGLKNLFNGFVLDLSGLTTTS